MNDATAKPADVASGKIFYNRNGKQTGTGTLVKTLVYTSKQLSSVSSSISIDTSMSGPTYNYTDGQMKGDTGMYGSYETVKAVTAPGGYSFRYGKVSWKTYQTNTVYIYAYTTKGQQKPATIITTDTNAAIWMSMQDSYLYVKTIGSDVLTNYPFTVTLYLD